MQTTEKTIFPSLPSLEASLLAEISNVLYTIYGEHQWGISIIIIMIIMIILISFNQFKLYLEILYCNVFIQICRYGINQLKAHYNMSSNVQKAKVFFN